MEYYLASGHIGNFRFHGDKLYKKAKPTEIQFYLNNSFEKEFNPKCFGIEGECVILENLLEGIPFPSLVDIKMGKNSGKFKTNEAKQQMQEKKMAMSSSETLGFRVSGYVTPEIKEYGLLIREEILIKWVLGKVIRKENKNGVLEFLERMSCEVSKHKRVYQATSLLIISGCEVTRMKWIDFTYWGTFVVTQLTRNTLTTT